MTLSGMFSIFSGRPIRSENSLGVHAVRSAMEYLWMMRLLFWMTIRQMASLTFRRDSTRTVSVTSRKTHSTAVPSLPKRLSSNAASK